MHKLKVLGLAFIAVFALSAVASATASAAQPKVLAEAFPVKYTATSNEALLEASSIAAPIKCLTSTSEGELTNEVIGTFHIHFEKCTLEGEECHGLGEAAGVILALGKIEVVFLKLGTGTGLTVGVLFTTEEVHIECKFLSILLRVKGTLVGSITPTNTKTKSFIPVVEQSKGNNKIVKYFNAAGTEEGTSLLTSVGTGAFALSGQETKEAKETTAKEIEIMG
jgi:hypothetical protein